MPSNSYWRTRLPGKTHDEKVSIIADAIVKLTAERPEESIKKKKLAEGLGFSYSTLLGEKCFPKLALDKLLSEGLITEGDGGIHLSSKGKEYNDSKLETTPVDFYPVNTTGPMGKVLTSLKRLFRTKYPNVADIFDCSNVSVAPEEVNIEMINPTPALEKTDSAFLVATLEKTIHSTYGKKVKVNLKTVTIKKAATPPMADKPEPKAPFQVQIGPMGQIVLLMRDLLGEVDFNSCTSFNMSNEEYSFSFYKMKKNERPS